MAFIKKILALKQDCNGFSRGKKGLSGICRIELDKGEGELFLTLVNAVRVAGCEYFITLFDGKGEKCSFKLDFFPKSFKTKLSSEFSFNGGLAVGIYGVNGKEIEIIAFTKEEKSKITLSDFEKAIRAEFLSKTHQNDCPEKENQEISEPSPVHPPYPPAEQPDPTVTPPQEFPSPKSEEVLSAYNDEAVATENYFEFENQINLDLNAVKELTEQKVLNEDGSPALLSAQEKPQSEIIFEDFSFQSDCQKNETNQRETPFFDSVKSELDNLFSTFPSEEGLEKAFLDSRWAKVFYSGDKFYVVGVIKENGKEKYICYGVPAVYSEQPPKELDGYCTFIPNSVFDLNGDGYWMMFQDALSGKCITPKNND